MDDDRNRERLMSAWSATPSAEEIARVRTAAAAVRRLRRVQMAMLGVSFAAAVTGWFAPDDSRLESSAQLLLTLAVVVFFATGFLAARRSATSGTPPDAGLGHVSRALRDERARELRWWVGGWNWGAWIAGTALLVAMLSRPGRLLGSSAHLAALALVAIGMLAVASTRYLRELRIRADLARLDALMARMDGRPLDPPRTPRRSVRAGLRLLELGVACWAGVTAMRGPDALVVNARNLMSAIHANAHWAQRLGLTHRGPALPVAGDPVDRYCAARARLAPSLATFAAAETHVTRALAIDLEERAGVGTQHLVRREVHAISWEKARLPLLTAADRALRTAGLRPTDLREIGARLETHDASTAFRLPPPQARALVAARLRVQALESILADPARSAIHALASAELPPAREALARLTAQGGPPPAPTGAPCGADPVPGIDWLTVLDADPSPWNEAVR